MTLCVSLESEQSLRQACFAKTQPHPSPILEKFFSPENLVSGFNENLAFLSIRNRAHQKTDPNPKTKSKSKKRIMTILKQFLGQGSTRSRRLYLTSF
jgi:hypothetical protein